MARPCLLVACERIRRPDVSSAPPQPCSDSRNMDFRSLRGRSSLVEEAMRMAAAKAEGRFHLTSHDYGKTRVRLLHVDRTSPKHQMHEFMVDTELRLSSVRDYVAGDNSEVVATDTQKNAVHVLAKQSGVREPEPFALLLAAHFLARYPQVQQVNVRVEERPWQRIQTPSGPHNHAFLMQPDSVHFCHITQTRQLGSKELSPPVVRAGIKGLRVLKTDQSKFVNFAEDDFRTLADSTERILATEVRAEWEYSRCTEHTINWGVAWRAARDAILETFAGPAYEGVNSPSVQHTLYHVQQAVLGAVPQIASVEVRMPNLHYLPLDLSAFQGAAAAPRDGRDLYLPVDEPSGNISAKLERAQLPDYCANSKL